MSQGGGRRLQEKKGRQGTCIKDTWPKPKGGRIEGGRCGCLGFRGSGGGKWRQLYLNNNKKRKNKTSNVSDVNFKHSYVCLSLTN